MPEPRAKLDRRPVIFGCGAAFADAGQADPARVGAKGASLVRMAGLGLAVPPGFVLPVALCRRIAEGLDPEPILAEGLADIAAFTGRTFASDLPLLVSVRSGAAISMPGMMDTILDVGATREATALIARETDEAFALDCRRRYLTSYAINVLGRPRGPFDEAEEEAADAAELVRRCETLAGDVPDDAVASLVASVRAVIASWDGERARQFRTIEGLKGEGTAVVVQAMVFGNRDARSATGVARTRDPATGEARLHGDYLARAQGEDVVDGFHTPKPLTRAEGDGSFEAWLPGAFDALAEGARAIEANMRDGVEIEFTVESGQVWFLQARAMKRTVTEAVRIAVAMAQEGVIDRDEALARADPQRAAATLTPELAPGQRLDMIARGTAASAGVASGRVVLSSRAALEAREPVILVRGETDPSDVAGIDAAAAVLTARGGRTSHAASVAVARGKPCVTGAGTVTIGEGGFETLGRRFSEGDEITVDGTRGCVYAGRLETVTPEPDGKLRTLLEWAGKG